MIRCEHDVPNKQRCSKCQNARRKARVQRAVDILGRRCNRCGITDPLAWDHVNDDGGLTRLNANGNYLRIWNQERAAITQIIDTGRSDRLQLLCPNCNYLKHHDREAYDAPPTYGPLKCAKAV